MRGVVYGPGVALAIASCPEMFLAAPVPVDPVGATAAAQWLPLVLLGPAGQGATGAALAAAAREAVHIASKRKTGKGPAHA